MQSTARSIRTRSAIDTSQAKAAADRLIRFSDELDLLELGIGSGATMERVALPLELAEVLIDSLEALSTGRSVKIIVGDDEITTSEAAKILNVSRPYVVKLLDEGQIPFRKVGTHRRIRVDDLLSYKERNDLYRRSLLDQMIMEAQEQGEYDFE